MLLLSVLLNNIDDNNNINNINNNDDNNINNNEDDILDGDNNNIDEFNLVLSNILNLTRFVRNKWNIQNNGPIPMGCVLKKDIGYSKNC